MTEPQVEQYTPVEGDTAVPRARAERENNTKVAQTRIEKLVNTARTDVEWIRQQDPLAYTLALGISENEKTVKGLLGDSQGFCNGVEYRLMHQQHQYFGAACGTYTDLANAKRTIAKLSEYAQSAASITTWRSIQEIMLP